MDLSPLHVVFAGLITLVCAYVLSRRFEPWRALLLALAATLVIGFIKELADMTPGALRVDLGGADITLLGRAELKDVWFDLAGMGAAVLVVGWSRLVRAAATKIVRP